MVVGPVAVNGKSANVLVPPIMVLTKVRVAVVIGAAAIVAVQVELGSPPFEPPHVQVVGTPALGKAGLAGVAIPLPRPHIVPEKIVSVLE